MGFTNPEGAGVGGWLALFVIIMAAITPVAMIFTTYWTLYGDPNIALAYPGTFGALQALEWGICAAVVGGCWYIAWRLNTVQVWSTVRLTIAGIWMLSVGALVAEFIGVSLLTGMPIGLLAEAAGAELVRPFIFSVVWTAYFLRSKRVANTYAKQADAGEAAAVFE